MSLPALLVPPAAALFLLAMVLITQGVRGDHRGILAASVGILAFLAVVYTVMMTFITRPL